CPSLSCLITTSILLRLSFLCFFFLTIRRPPSSPLFPYTTLFRSLLARDVLQRVPGAEILFDVKCSQGLSEDIAAHGGRPSMWKTGHSLIKSRLHQTGAPLAGEMSGHMFFSEGFFGFDDALFAAGRLLRFVAASGRSLADLVDSIPKYHATPETRLACPDE